MVLSGRQGPVASAGDGSPPPPLGFFSLLALGINGIVGVGIFFAPRQVAAAVPGWAGIVVYLLVTLLLLPTGLVYARLGRAFPVDGGPFVYARAAFGSHAGFAVGFTSYVSALFSTSTVLVGLVENVTAGLDMTSPGLRLGAELALLSILTVALSRGLRLSAVAWSTVTVLKVLPLVALPVAAFLVPIHAWSGAHSSPGPNSGLLAATLPVLFAFQGFEIVPLPAAQVRNAERNVPLATLGSLVFASLLYVALHASCVYALPQLENHELPLAAAARVYGGMNFARFLGLATSFSALGIVIGMLAMTPRYLAPLGRESALGFGLDRQSSRAVPERAFAVTYVVLFLILLANAAWGSIRNLLTLSSLAVTLQYAVTAASLFVLASRGSAGLSRDDRWPAPLTVASCVLFWLGASRIEVPILAGMIALGFLVRALGKRRGV